MSETRQIETVVLDHVPAGVLVCDTRGRVVYSNPAARSLYACVEGGPVPKVLTDDACGAKRWEGDVLVGDRRFFCRASPIQDQAGRWVGTICVSFPRPQGKRTAGELHLNEVGRRIARARAEMSMTQQELADQLGVTRRSLQGYESGRVAPYRHLDRLCELLGRPARWFLIDDSLSAEAPLRNVLREEWNGLEQDFRRIVHEELTAALAPARPSRHRGEQR